MYFNANAEDVARAVSAIGIGMFLGALIGGLFVDILGTWKILLVTGVQLLSTVTILFMPYVGTISVLWFMFFLLGTAGGVVNVGKKKIREIDRYMWYLCK
jgi:predicted MFS family arabinose efflux permease